MKIKKYFISKGDSDYDVIGDYISSNSSVTKIDAMHTDTIITNGLIDLEQEIDKLNKKSKDLQSSKSSVDGKS